jgi:coenzyme F420-reducing hydrogenase beta subunit
MDVQDYKEAVHCADVMIRVWQERGDAEWVAARIAKHEKTIADAQEAITVLQQDQVNAAAEVTRWKRSAKKLRKAAKLEENKRAIEKLQKLQDQINGLKE